MYSGHLTEKKGYFYCVITYKTSDGKRKEKWISTKLSIKGNKRRAEAMLQEHRRNFVPPKEDSAFDALESTIPFTAYMRLWLDYAKPTVAPTTFGGYQSTINRTVTDTRIDGETVIIASDRTKTKASHRTFPMSESLKKQLLKWQEIQKRNRKFCGNCYNTEDLEYVFTDELGNRFKPRYIEDAFPRLLQKHGLRKIRFHDLRRTCASLMHKKADIFLRIPANGNKKAHRISLFPMRRFDCYFVVREFKSLNCGKIAILYLHFCISIFRP